MTDKHRRSFAVVKVAGAPLSQDAARALSEVRVEQSANVPDAFILRFNDNEGVLADDANFKLGAKVEVGVDVEGVTHRLMTGEITGLSAEMDGPAQQEQFIVTGLDGRHRLTRGVKVNASVNSKDSDAVRKIAQGHGLKASVDATTKVHDYLLQSVSDFEFVDQRAQACGYDWWVSDGTLYFKKPTSSGAAIKVTWGDDLRRFRLRLSSAESASEAEVRGWDPVAQKAITGKAPMRTAGLATDAPIGNRINSAVGQFPATRLAWGVTVLDPTEAETQARAMADRIGSEQAVAKGEILGNPAFRPGVQIDVSGLATSLCGKYRLTRVEHVFRAGELYLTRFESGGARDHTLVDLLGGHSRAAAPAPSAPALGGSLVVGVVTNKNDPDKLGRVKVRFAGIADTVESAWARVVSVGAGKSRGLQVIPDVEDEVLVGFEYGDLRRPLVIGGLWSGHQASPKHSTDAGRDGAVWRTKGGHVLSMSDAESPSDKYIHLGHSSGKTGLHFGPDKSSIDTEADLSVESAKGITIKGKTNLTIEAANITIKATAKLVLEGGGTVEIKSNGPLKGEGTIVDLNGKATATLQGGAMTQVKGGIVKIN